jgi:hypothetical protein
LFQQHQTLSRTVPITNCGFGQKRVIVKITAIRGFATCNVSGLTPVALHAHVSIHQIPTAFWVFLLVHHGGENARQGNVSLPGGRNTRPDCTPTKRSLTLIARNVFSQQRRGADYLAGPSARWPAGPDRCSVGASPAVKEQRTIVPRALGCAAGRSVQLPLSADLLGCVGRGVRIKILPTGLSPCRASISKVHGRPVQHGLVSSAVCVGHSRAH